MTEDLTLDEIRVRIAPAIAANAAFDGWGDAARDMAAEANAIDRDVAALAFPHGAVDMIRRLVREHRRCDGRGASGRDARRDEDPRTHRRAGRGAGSTRSHPNANRCVARSRFSQCRSIWHAALRSAGAAST